MVLNSEQLALFFERIGLRYEDYKDRCLDSVYLNELYKACYLSLTFENLDILAGKPTSLRQEDLYEKFIVRRRGGSCFEMNGLCGIFLRSLGFGVRDFLSRFFRDAGGKVPMRRHRLLEVTTLDGKFLWDIGIGMRSPRIVLKIVENLQQKQDNGEVYKLVKEEFYGWVLYEYHNGEWLRILSFTEEPQDDVDFITAMVWCELHPDSPFNKQYMIAVKTEEGIKTLDGLEYKESVRDTIVVRRTLTESEVPELLRKEFYLNV